MTNEEKSRISEMRNQGFTYAKIAETLAISRNTVKTYCWRSQISDDAITVMPKCKQCRCPIERQEKHRQRLFCSDKCRAAWWYANHEDTPKKEYHMVCICCGKPFVSRGNKTRKYCSHACYITNRFG